VKWLGIRAELSDGGVGWGALTVAERARLPRGGLHTHLHDGTGRGLGKGVVGGEKFGVWLPALKAGEDLGRDPALKAGWARSGFVGARVVEGGMGSGSGSVEARSAVGEARWRSQPLGKGVHSRWGGALAFTAVGEGRHWWGENNARGGICGATVGVEGGRGFGARVAAALRSRWGRAPLVGGKQRVGRNLGCGRRR
jgi:hypothetical protein